MPAFIEVHTTAGMQELVNVSAIQTVRQLKKYSQLILADEEQLEVVEMYDELKDLIKQAGDAIVSKPNGIH